MHDVLIILLVLAFSELPHFIWNAAWSLWVYRGQPSKRREWMKSIIPSLPRAIGTFIVGVSLVILLTVDSATTNRIEGVRQQALLDAMTKQTEAVNAQTKALLAFLKRMDDQTTDNATGSK